MLKNYATYIGANALGILGGLISFPIMARLLSYEDFGILGYFEAHILILAGVLKLGSQHSIVRFYSRFEHPGAGKSNVRFATNLIWFPIVTAITLSALLASGLWAWHQFRPMETYPYLAVLIWLSLSIALLSVLLNWYVAQERAPKYTAFTLSSGWMELCFVLVTLFFINRSPLGVYEARLASTGIIALVALHVLNKYARRDWSTLDFGTIRQSLSYGMVLLLNELALIILAFIDRYMIEAMTGSFAALGVYTLGYNLAMFVMRVIEQSFNKAFMPVINRLYESEGPASVRALKTRVAGLMLYPATLVAIMLIVVGEEALRILGGAEKMASASVFVWTGVGFAFVPVLTTAGFGLTLERRSGIVLMSTVLAIVANVALNLILLPRLGIMGAVYATVASYAVMTLLRIYWCPQELKSRFPFHKLPLPFACATAVWLVAELTGLFGFEHPVLRIGAGGIIAAVCFLLPVYLFDREIRNMVDGVINSVFKRVPTQ